MIELSNKKKTIMAKINKTIFYFICSFIIILTKNSVYANQENNLKNDIIYEIAFCKSSKPLAICINLDKKYKIAINLLNEPYRIVLNFDRKIQISKKSLSKVNDKNDLINQIRFGNPTASSSRLVFELDNSGIISEFFYIKNINKNNGIVRLQIQIAKTSRASYEIAKHVLFKNNGNILVLNGQYNNKLNYKKNNNGSMGNVNNLPKSRPPKKITDIKKNISLYNNKKKNFIVFIDPGHGGRDPGAVGKLGTLEKKITLQVSLELAKSLKKTDNITPILSRTTDIYIPLRKRINLAKINKADIFISLHADASKNHAANGVSVFSLSDKASDKEAKMIAERENAVDIIPGIETNINDPIIFGTLIKMFQRQAMNDSAFLARNIITNLEKTKLAFNRGHRFAGFAVLKAPNIPSVLIEIGFISNLKEEKKMLNKEYIKKLSQSLTKAIQNYLLKQNN